MFSTLYFKRTITKSEGGLITCLQSGHKVISLNGFSNETWNVGCTLISSGNSNLYMFLNTRSTMGNEAPILGMNFGMRPWS